MNIKINALACEDLKLIRNTESDTIYQHHQHCYLCILSALFKGSVHGCLMEIQQV